MIVSTQTGVLAAGTIGTAPQLRHVGQDDRPVLKFSLRYGTQEDETGKRRGKYLDIDVWDNAEALDGMFTDGDAVLVVGRAVKSREYNGKTYYSMSADGLFPAAAVVFRWVQQAMRLNHAPDAFTPVSDAPPPEFLYTADPDIAGHELYPGEQLSAYAVRPAGTPPAAAPDSGLIQADEDLPF